MGTSKLASTKGGEMPASHRVRYLDHFIVIVCVFVIVVSLCGIAILWRGP